MFHCPVVGQGRIHKAQGAAELDQIRYTSETREVDKIVPRSIDITWTAHYSSEQQTTRHMWYTRKQVIHTSPTASSPFLIQKLHPTPLLHAQHAQSLVFR